MNNHMLHTLFIPIAILLLQVGFSCVLAVEASGPLPVVVDTDIGSDVDDAWALALALASPEFDLRLVTTGGPEPRDKARLAARLLEAAGRADVPIGIGLERDGRVGPLADWAGDYRLSDYPGALHEDGVEALIRTILESEQTVTLLLLGPATNVAEALRREPRIAEKARVVAMSGSVDRGYAGAPTPSAEHNVRRDPEATAALYAAPWEVWIAPLDTAGLVRLDGEPYRRLLRSESRLTRTLLDAYQTWAYQMRGRFDPDAHSSTLFAAAAVYLALRPEAFLVEEVRLQVTATGLTRREPDGAPVRAALRWKDLEGFKEFVVERLE